MSKKEIVFIAARVLAKTIDPIEGCRRIVRYQGELSEIERHNPNFVTLVGIESETDHCPVGVGRRLWEGQAVAEQDRELAEYLQRIEGQLLEACRALIVDFS